jgi:ATPase subunit of ABC transporter with duplicated ATPase domains
VPSLSLANVSLSTPDGRSLFSGISLDFSRERVGLVGRNGIGKSTLLRLLRGELEPAKGRVERTGTIGTMRQAVQVSAGETVAHLLGISGEMALLRRAETGIASIDELADADWSLEARAMEALAQVGLDVALDAQLDTLSGGQRTRAALAGAVFGRPDFLLLDEPTNDLDREGRRAVRDLLESWREGAIVVSHDRELLQTMDAIVELTTLGAARYGGNWSDYRARKALELSAAEHDLAASERRMTEIRRKAQQAMERKQRRDGAGSRKAARGDMPRILAGARRERAEKSGGENSRLADRQRAAGAEALTQARERVERLEKLSITLAPTGLASSQRVLDIHALTHGYDQEEPVLRNVSLSMVGPQRLAIAGANGSGKSTLLALVAGRLTPRSGRVQVHVPFALFDQRMTMLDPASTIAENFSRLNPKSDENSSRAALARFQFRATAAEQLAGTLSGGQMLRAGLACILGSAKPPPLLVLDEPTNHLDLESIAAVEAGLRAYDGALLIVSHDEAFLQEIGVTRRLLLN